MTNLSLINSKKVDQQTILSQIAILQKELSEIKFKINEFESMIRIHISDLIIEEQELFALYNLIKRAKKASRLKQKKQGKNYKVPKEKLPNPEIKNSNSPNEEEKEKKRLYREAMLHVHPDKYQMTEQSTEAANKITVKLIEIYKTGSLENLQAYHSHIFNGNAGIVLKDAASKIKITANLDYLEQEREKLVKDIELAKKDHLYQVLTSYQNPISFVDELKDYYNDRIFKLRKRTRKGL
jgi:hypothetical protein